MVRHESLLLLEPRRDRDVIGVEASNEWGPGEAKRPVERRSTPVVLLAVDDDPRIARSVLRQDLRARVRGPVVDHDQLEVREGLREHALDGLSQEPLAVVDGHYDRHARSQGHEFVEPQARQPAHEVADSVGAARRSYSRAPSRSSGSAPAHGIDPRLKDELDALRLENQQLYAARRLSEEVPP